MSIWKNYKWQRRNTDGDICQEGSLMAKSDWEAKHFCKTYNQWAGNWIHRGKVFILDLLGTSDYVTLKQESITWSHKRWND